MFSIAIWIWIMKRHWQNFILLPRVMEITFPLKILDITLFESILDTVQLVVNTFIFVDQSIRDVEWLLNFLVHLFLIYFLQFIIIFEILVFHPPDITEMSMVAIWKGAFQTDMSDELEMSKVLYKFTMRFKILSNLQWNFPARNFMHRCIPPTLKLLRPRSSEKFCFRSR